MPHTWRLNGYKQVLNAHTGRNHAMTQYDAEYWGDMLTPLTPEQLQELNTISPFNWGNHDNGERKYECIGCARPITGNAGPQCAECAYSRWSDEPYDPSEDN